MRCNTIDERLCLLRVIQAMATRDPHVGGEGQTSWMQFGQHAEGILAEIHGEFISQTGASPNLLVAYTLAFLETMESEGFVSIERVDDQIACVSEGPVACLEKYVGDMRHDSISEFENWISV